MPELFGLDFETYSACDLRKHGLDRYVNDPSFTVLRAGVAQLDSAGHVATTWDIDMVFNRRSFVDVMERLLDTDSLLVCHNAGFEQAVLRWLRFNLSADRFIDSAVVARALGAAGHLEAAAPQLLNVDKMAEGKDLIKLFSIPGAYQEKHDTRYFVTDVIRDHPDDWKRFGEYCVLDASLGVRIVGLNAHILPRFETAYAALTLEMNDTGWPVDVELVEEMQRRYLENQALALEHFRQNCDSAELNLNSLIQLKKWCAERGIKAKSFDEKRVASMLKRLEAKIATLPSTDPKWKGYWEVTELLRTKQILGGSSLKKLQTILDTVGKDGRLRDQYLHIGAGQSWRTTGRSVQMQNLKRLGEEIDDVGSLLDDPDCEWDNTKLAKNLRQVFTASRPDGRLIVGDFSSVESRGLAWLAGEEWKLDSYRKGEDLYKVLASRIFGTDYSTITKQQRQTGKVGELSCGYQAGPGAVQAFAENMGIEFSEAEASKLVTDWRSANPKIVNLWDRLDEGLRHVAQGTHRATELKLPDGFSLKISSQASPMSLARQHATTRTIKVEVFDTTDTLFLVRFFHGAYFRGRDLCYYKPSDRKTGDLWRSQYVDPKTGQLRYYTLYGGKLAGILTQSFCRELFMQSLHQVQRQIQDVANVSVIGQFHDEIVLDWYPASNSLGCSLKGAKAILNSAMSDPGRATSFPLAADVKDDYRYTK